MISFTGKVALLGKIPAKAQLPIVTENTIKYINANPQFHSGSVKLQNGDFYTDKEYKKLYKTFMTSQWK